MTPASVDDLRRRLAAAQAEETKWVNIRDSFMARDAAERKASMDALNAYDRALWAASACRSNLAELRACSYRPGLGWRRRRARVRAEAARLEAAENEALRLRQAWKNVEFIPPPPGTYSRLARAACNAMLRVGELEGELGRAAAAAE